MSELHALYGHDTKVIHNATTVGSLVVKGDRDRGQLAADLYAQQSAHASAVT